MRAVVSLCVRGLVSLSFGKVLVGAAMLWTAAAFLSMGSGNSIQTGSASTRDGANVSTAAVELAGYFGDDSDGTDGNAGLPAPRWGGMGRPQPSSSGAIPVSSSHRNAQQAMPSSDTSATDDGAYSASVDFGVTPFRMTAGAGQKASTEKANSNSGKSNTNAAPPTERAQPAHGQGGSVLD
ncbi:MAG: hypothetical protein J2P32_15475, partial [Actinobacteria bacterium]|nr:hypothetical protein [Actinomycetota bacterium]